VQDGERARIAIDRHIRLCHAVSADVTVGRPDPAGGEDIGAALSVVDERRPSVKTPMALLAVTDSNAIKPNSATCVFILLILRGFMSQTRPTRLRLALQAQPSILHAKRAAVVATMSKMRRVMPRCGTYCA
jgi:hypothetical protein